MSAPVSRIDIAPNKVVRWVILSVVGILFAIPIAAMVEFTLRAGLAGGYTFDHWTGLFDPANASKYDVVYVGLTNSLVLAIVTVAIVLLILLPTMVLVQLKFPKFRRVLEFVCIIPITVPAVVLVVGLAPVYSVVAKIFGSGTWTLAFAYGITVLPYAYRTIQSNLGAIDVNVLSEAARSLGASWISVFWRVLIPNLRRGIMAASFISVAVVLGEFTIASLLSRQNLQTSILLMSQNDPYVAIIIALLALAFVFVLLLLSGWVGNAGKTKREKSGVKS